MQMKILVVDDQKGVRRLLEELFKKDNWIVNTAADGREAINKVGEFQPDIILMDMVYFHYLHPGYLHCQLLYSGTRFRAKQ
jgi:CheY-like chemotaxis protein